MVLVQVIPSMFDECFIFVKANIMPVIYVSVFNAVFVKEGIVQQNVDKKHVKMQAPGWK